MRKTTLGRFSLIVPLGALALTASLPLRERHVWLAAFRAVSRSAPTALLTGTVAAKFPEWDGRSDFMVRVSGASSLTVPRDVMADYVRRNRYPTRIWFTSSPSVRLLESSEYKQLLKESKDTDWAKFRQQLPNIDQVLGVSRPGFARDGRLALVYYEVRRVEGPSVGKLAMLERNGEAWRITEAATVITE